MQTVREIVESVRARRISSVEATRECVSAIRQRDGRLGAFLTVDEQGALERAREVDDRLARGGGDLPLAGVPIALKDNMCTTFGATTCASKILLDYRAPYDCHVAQRLTRAGAIIVGKTNLDEFAMGSSTENSGLGVTRNPWALERVPGGSSGGSAVAVAAGLVPAALGSDTGGSIRQPASLTGVVGLKPSYGRVSRYGLVAFGSSLDQIGPLARTAEDAAMILSVISGHDARDSTCVDRAVPDYARQLDRPLRGVRIGVAEEYFAEGLQDDVRAAVEQAIELLTRHGARAIPIDLPHMKYGIACYYVIAMAEASSNLSRYDGVHYGHRTDEPQDVIHLYSATRAEGFGAEVKRRIMLGTYVLSSGYYEAYYLRAMKVRTLVRRDFEHAFQNVDAICSPVSPTTAFKAGERTRDPIAMYLADVYTTAANLAGIPAISVPCGFDSAGLPIGLQLSAPPFEEGRLLQIAHQFQLLTDYHTRRPG